MKFMLDTTMIVFTRQMRLLLRNPVWVFFGLTQPILYLVLFGPLLTNVRAGGLGGSASWSLFVPGLLLQLAIFGAGFAGFGIIQEVREGVLDRQRVTPAPRVSLLLGRTLSNVVTIGAQAVILVLVAIPFGLQPSWVGVIVTLVLVCVLARAGDLRGVVLDGHHPQGRGRICPVRPGRLAAAAAVVGGVPADVVGADVAAQPEPYQPAGVPGGRVPFAVRGRLLGDHRGGRHHRDRGADRFGGVVGDAHLPAHVA